MAGHLSFDALREDVRDGAIDTVVTAFVDMQGRLIGKRMTGHHFCDTAWQETHCCDYLLANDIDMEPVPGYAAASWERGYGDFVARPDLGTLRRLPWLPGTALVLCDVLDHHGQDVPHSPRAILRRQIDRLARKGLKAMMASELEFYIYDESYESARAKHYRDLKPSSWYIEDYHVFQTSKEEPLLRALRTGLDAAGVPVECSKGEWGPGQSELNIVYADALEMADRHAILKNSAKEIAWSQGKAITFMAKPAFALAGNSCHVHASLRDLESDAPLFHSAEGTDGLSDLAQHFLAGQLSHAREITYFLAPYINSYKRFQAGTFAPTKAVWSGDNRTSGFRLCGHGRSLRIECRIGGADLNPYLAYAALLAAGLAGIEQRLSLEPRQDGDSYARSDLREVPKTLRDALHELDESTMLKQAFGDEVIAHYLHAGQWEQSEYDRRVTDWELMRGFERY